MGLLNCIVVLGGDARLRAAALGFSALAYPTNDFPNAADSPALRQALRNADLILLPIPALNDGIIRGTELSMQTLLDAVSPSAQIYGGSLPAALPKNCTDYAQLESFALANAIPTAEGAIGILMQQLPITLCGANGLIIGFGRIGKALAARLSALGTRLTVSARKQSDLDAIEALGLRCDRTGEFSQGLEYDFIINTAPALVLDAAHLRTLSTECFLLDLASQPGGIDFDACRTLGLSFSHALALPGKVAPKTAGLIIRDTVLDDWNLPLKGC